MAKRNRKTLKNFFGKGALPTQENFADLIDSSLNLVDEGFDKSAEKGLEISSIGNHDGLISFSRNNDWQNPLWSISYDQDLDTLRFNNLKQQSTPLSFDPQGRVGINTSKPAWDLDVQGNISSKGRAGSCQPDDFVDADGKWHDITGKLNGCHGFEVVAGVGLKKSGKYALIQAIALNTFHPKGWLFNFLGLKRRIKSQQAYYRSKGDKLKLRWHGLEDGYTLQIRTNSSYGQDVQIRIFLTRLWFDEDMGDCLKDKE